MERWESTRSSWIPNVISPFLMMNIRGKDNSEIPPRSYTASLVIIGHVDRMIIMPWWRAYFRPNIILGEWERPLHIWRAHDKVAGDEHTLPWWRCLSNEWPIGLPKGVQKALRPNWTARRYLRVMERFFWWRDEEPQAWYSPMRVWNPHPKRLTRSWLLDWRREGSPSNSWATDSIENKNPR